MSKRIERVYSHWHSALSAVLALGLSAACTTDSDPGDEGMNNEGGNDTGAGGASGGVENTGGMTANAGSGGAPPAPVAALQCESTQFPKLVAAGTNPVIVDFETGALVLVDAAGMPIVNFAFAPPASEVGGGTYAYNEVDTAADGTNAAFDTNVVRTAELVDDGNGGQALSVTLAGATGFGGGMGLFFFPCADGSVYSGISFRARGSLPERMLADATVVPAGTVNIRLDVGEVRTTESSLDTFACDAGTPVDATRCVRPASTFVITDDWQDFTFMWADFTGGMNNGAPVTPNGDNFLGMDLSMDNAFGTENTLVLAIDDVSFVE